MASHVWDVTQKTSRPKIISTGTLRPTPIPISRYGVTRAKKGVTLMLGRATVCTLVGAMLLLRITPEVHFRRYPRHAYTSRGKLAKTSPFALFPIAPPETAVSWCSLASYTKSLIPHLFLSSYLCCCGMCAVHALLHIHPSCSIQPCLGTNLAHSCGFGLLLFMSFVSSKFLLYISTIFFSPRPVI